MNTKNRTAHTQPEKRMIALGTAAAEAACSINKNAHSLPNHLIFWDQRERRWPNGVAATTGCLERRALV
jgi:hypothetical protein